MKQYLLAGDIGGTKTLLSLAETTSQPGTPLTQFTPLVQETYPSGDYGNFLNLVLAFLQTAQTQLGQLPPIAQACFGIAGPVVNQTSVITNLSWPPLVAEDLAQSLQIPKVLLINDFTAIGYGLLGLEKTDYVCLQDVPPDPQAPRAILGAGTGLGEGFLIPTGPNQYRVFSSEGSHGDFAPRHAQEFQLLEFFKTHYQIDRVSIDRVVSGTGIPVIYHFLQQQSARPVAPALAPLYEAWQQSPETTPMFASAISQAALNREDAVSEATLKLFVSAYGAEAGNLALKLLPYGGVYVAGGIAPKILPLLQDGTFLTAFQEKGRMKGLLVNMPVYLITHPQIGLKGAMIAAAIA